MNLPLEIIELPLSLTFNLKSPLLLEVRIIEIVYFTTNQCNNNKGMNE